MASAAVDTVVQALSARERREGAHAVADEDVGLGEHLDGLE